MATPITAIDTPNISVVSNDYVVNITGSQIDQDGLNYLLSPKYSFTGSFKTGSLQGGEVEFPYGILQPPTQSTTSTLAYPTTTKTDFSFFLNGVRIEDEQVISFTENLSNTRSTGSFNLGFTLRDYDVVTAQGKFKV